MQLNSHTNACKRAPYVLFFVEATLEATIKCHLNFKSQAFGSLINGVVGLTALKIINRDHNGLT